VSEVRQVSKQGAVFFDCAFFYFQKTAKARRGINSMWNKIHQQIEAERKKENEAFDAQIYECA
jgi:hypothetical protein